MNNLYGNQPIINSIIKKDKIIETTSVTPKKPFKKPTIEPPISVKIYIMKSSIIFRVANNNIFLFILLFFKIFIYQNKTNY